MLIVLFSSPLAKVEFAQVGWLRKQSLSQIDASDMFAGEIVEVSAKRENEFSMLLYEVGTLMPVVSGNASEASIDSMRSVANHYGGHKEAGTLLTGILMNAVQTQNHRLVIYIDRWSLLGWKRLYASEDYLLVVPA
jgi:hypothetical protein